jgi:MoaA/NifB/PqqE/SkfB family radical SAM enzyme
VLRVLRVIRGGADSLTLTGGEPLLHPEIISLVTRARHELDFRQLTLLTNGLLLPENEPLLPALDRLVVSLDSVNPELWSGIVNAPPDTTQAVIDNVCTYARRQRELGYRMIANCVLTPETLPGALEVLDFCIEHDLCVSFSPQAVGNWPRYDLLVSDEYRSFLERLVALKRRGAPILGSLDYLHTLLQFRPYSCYPTLAPRVMPNGDLLYPCWPIEKGEGSHGGRPCNLLEVESWDQALAIAVGKYGVPPRVCTSCFQQCFAEPSLMQARPLSLLRELLLHPTSRRGGLASYAPG